ncbi:MAG: RecX family transcriptional regulator [Sphingomicrobium sp.]
MTARTPRKPRPPLDQTRLEELALAYVGRFATTRSKLAAYLGRKLRERGWREGPGPDLEALVERHARSGLVDDAAFAMAKAHSLGRRGYGKARVRQQLYGAGVGADDAAPALDHAASEAADAALRLAKRRRFGPFAAEIADPKLRDRQLAAMIRAGHPLKLSLTILRCAPGEVPDADSLFGNL